MVCCSSKKIIIQICIYHLNTIFLLFQFSKENLASNAHYTDVFNLIFEQEIVVLTYLLVQLRIFASVL
jgi:hypothetical protein